MTYVKIICHSDDQKLPGNNSMVLQDITNSPSEHRVKGQMLKCSTHV